MVPLPDHELQVAQLLEPIYKARDDWQKLVDVVRDPWCATRSIRRARSSCSIRSASCTRWPATIGDGAYDALARALREEPGLTETQTRLERLARTLDRWKDLVALYERGSVTWRRRATRAADALYDAIAQI